MLGASACAHKGQNGYHQCRPPIPLTERRAHTVTGASIELGASMRGPEWRVSVVPSDLNLDGFMDVLVVACNTAQAYCELLLYFGARRPPTLLRHSESRPPATPGTSMCVCACVCAYVHVCVC